MTSPIIDGQCLGDGLERRSRATACTHRVDGRRCGAFALLTWLAIMVPAVLSSAPVSKTREAQPELTLTVCVYNYAKLSAGDLRQAEGEARRVIRGAGVETIWLDCTASGPALRPDRGGPHQECSSGLAFGRIVTLRIMNRFDYNGTTLNPGTFGYSNRPVLATVLYDRIATFAERNGEPEVAPVLLGDIMAHEIGHLLLGTDAHSPTGIMRSKWDRAQIQRALQGRLSFTSDESSTIRTAIEVRMESQGTSAALLKPSVRRTAP